MVVSPSIQVVRFWKWVDEKFYIERHDSLSHQREFKKCMRIYSVVGIKAFLRYGYDYLSEIVLRRADFQEHKIAEKDFKNFYPSDFEDLNLLLLQGHLDHLHGSDKSLNLTKPGWDAKGFEFKHDYTIIESPRAVVFSVNNNKRKIMRFNEMYKFNDGTLIRIMEALDYRVKEYRVNRLNSEHPSDIYVFTMKMEILLEPTSNKLMVGDYEIYTLEDLTLMLEILSRRFFLRLNLPDHSPWLSAVVYLHSEGVIAYGCLGDMKTYYKNRKLERVVGVVMTYAPNALGDMTATLKDPSRTMGGLIHYRVF
uniref:Uncharacterized protein n=1 Tax=Tanacetum cinerariifolium TaxID=118510 RepID=A0A699GNN4_TANCI|nr:hypothetical protein [Tanacetum cinerariifolium]